MKNLAVVICNWNKKEYVLKCIESVKKSKIPFEYDIIVVDNASTDNSAEAMEELFGNDVILIRNKENLGGSGGFNTGLRFAQDNNYQYVHLLDNDIILDENAIFELYKLMENDSSIGAAGSKLLQMDAPAYLQELGANFDWETYHISPHYKHSLDNDLIPHIINCDYVPACSVLVRMEVIHKLGIMDDSCFIYWDDMEWFYRMKVNGYKVVAYNPSKVWHKMGASSPVNTFATYYFWRNRLNFFMNYIEDKDIEKFSKSIIDELFQTIYMCNFKGKYNIAKTTLLAVDDALRGIRGKAIDGRIHEREIIASKFEESISNVSSINVIVNCNLENLLKILNVLGFEKISTLIMNNNLDEEILSFAQKNQIPLNQISMNAKTIQISNHITESTPQKNVDFYIDQYQSIIQGNNIQQFLTSFHNMKEIFTNIYLPNFIQQVKDFRAKKGE